MEGRYIKKLSTQEENTGKKSKMNKNRLTIEEIKNIPMSEFPITVECDDGFYTDFLRVITLITNVANAAGMITIVNDSGYYEHMMDDHLMHFPSLKQPRIERFYEYTNCAYWYNKDDKRLMSDGSLSQLHSDNSSSFKTGRYFDYDLDEKKIVGKVQCE